MTRVTNFGRKRTYIEAGFAHDQVDPKSEVNLNTYNEKRNTSIGAPTDEVYGDIHPKKKRNSGRKATPSTVEVVNEVTGDGGDEDGASEILIQESKKKESSKYKAKKLKRLKEKKSKGRVEPTTRTPISKNSSVASWRGEPSESRRQRRISERQADTTCFACRKKGHAAKDCPEARLDDGLEDEAGTTVIPSVGMCYRCGSTRHSLSRCKKVVNASDPLPFASCFVCLEKGHLTSSCPKNQGKGIYPNGGSCKLCGDITHLAKNCGLRKDVSNGIREPMIFGSSAVVDAGADEDDFHIFQRRTAQVDQEEKEENKTKRAIDLKSGAHSGIIKAFGKSATVTTKKVVFF